MAKNAESELQRNEVVQIITIQPGLLPSLWHSFVREATFAK